MSVLAGGEGARVYRLVGGSDHEIQCGEGLLLKFASAFTQVGERHALGDSHYGVPDFFHHTAHRAARFVRARTFLVKTFADTTDRRQSALNVPYDFGQ